MSGITPPAGIAPPPITSPAPPPAAPPAAPAAPWAGQQGVWNLGEGAAAKPWYEAIPEPEVRELIKTKNYANPHETALAYYNLNKLQNGAPDVVALLPPNATPEQEAAFFTKLGRPEAADKYDIKLADGVQVDTDLLTWTKGAAHKLGLNNKQAQTLVDEWNSMATTRQAAALEATQVAEQQEMTALETKWKGAGKDLTAEKAQGLTVLKSLGKDAADVVEKVEASIGTAAVVELLALIGARTKEGGLGATPPPGGDPNDPANMSKEQAGQRVAALYQDADFMTKYNDKKHPANQIAVSQMLALQMKANS